MKKMITGALMLASIYAIAQSNGDRATKLRQISYYSQRYVAAAWEGSDSAKYIYNNPNAGFGQYMFMYDTSYAYYVLSGVWTVGDRGIYTFNDAGSVTNYEGHTYDGTQYNRTYRNTYSRNADNNITEEVRYSWDGTTWQATMRDMNTFNANGDQTTRLEQQFIAGAWENYRRFTYEYDANNRQTSYAFQIWSSGAGAWNNYQRSLSFYNALGQADTIISQDGSGNSWTNNYLYVYSYTSANVPEVTTGYEWVGAAWVPKYRNTIVYNANNMPITYTTYTHNGSIFINQSRRLDEYSTGNLLTQRINQDYVAGTGTWANVDRLNQTFNAGDYPEQVSQFNWIGGAWEPIYKMNYTYEGYDDATGIANLQQLQGTSLYPNPCTHNTMLAFNNPQPGEATITVSDLHGKTVYNSTQHYAAGQQHVLLDAGTWATGMYIANISTAIAKANIKLVKN